MIFQVIIKKKNLNLSYSNKLFNTFLLNRNIK